MKRFVKIAALCIVMSLLATLLCLPAQALGTPTNTKTIVSSGSIGTGNGKQITVADFTTSDFCGFEAIGNITDPTFETSAAWNTKVLYSWIDSAESETGIRGTLASTALLQGATTLSVRLLAQYTKTTSYTATLRLEGVDKTGAPLILEAKTPVNASNWQTVTFDISAFVESASLDAPCTLTLLTSSDAESEEFVLWVHSIYTNAPEAFPDFIIPVAAAVCGFILGFVLFFVIYRATCKRNRRPRWEER